MKVGTTIFLIIVSSSALANDVASRQAWNRSTTIAKAIVSGEADLKKALSYGDESGYEREVTRPMTRQLQWWRELEEQNPQEFRPYRSCLFAGSAFNQYGADHWAQPGLSRDRLIENNKKQYKSELEDCRQALKKRKFR